MLSDFAYHFFKRSGQGREGRALPSSGTRGKTSPSTEQYGQGPSQAFGGNRKKIPHGPMVLKLSRHQEAEIKLGRKALLPSRVSLCGSPHPLLPVVANPHQHQNHLTPVLWQRQFLLLQANQIFPALCSNREGFPLFKTSSLVNPHQRVYQR